MKTDASVGYLMKIRAIALCAALAVIFGLEVYVGASLAARIGHTTARQTDNLAIPHISPSSLLSMVE